MDPKKLEEMIVKHKSEGRKPFFVNCTSGTTVMGAFDPINAIADICQEHNVWMHIDVSKEYTKSEKTKQMEPILRAKG